MARSTTFDVLAYPSASDSLSNPYIEMLYGESEGSVFRISPFSIRGAMLKKVDVVHLHWPEWTIVQSSPWKAYVRLCAFVLCMTVVRARGAAVVWTVHNLHPHRRISRVREWLLYTFLRRIVDHQVHLTEATLRIMRETGHKALPSSPVSVVPHGPLASPSDFSRRDAFRGEAGVPRDGRLLVFFGGIDRYKGVDGLIAAFRGVPGPDVRLAVCGKFADDEIAADVTDAAGPDARVLVKGGFLSDDSLADLVAGADLVVLPYAAGLNSGSLFYALSAPRQVLMPDTPTFRAVADQIGSRWIHFYEGAISADDIVAALASDAPDAPPRLVTWTSVWEQTEAAYLVAITSRKRARSA